MADRSAIEWTEATWNPTTGCDRTSPGCDNCYALTLSRRLKAMGMEKYAKDGDPRTSGPGFGLTVHPDALSIPETWKSPRLVFVNSMSDLFHRDVPDSFIADVFDVARRTPQHTYQVLTKQSKRLRDISGDLEWPGNLWIGVSVENENYTFRINHLRQVQGAAVKFISFEPLLGPVGAINLDGIDWVIAGGESGHGYRPVEINWVREIRDSCRSAQVAFFFKQWGGRTAKSGGRELDGKIHNAMPFEANRRAS